MHENESWNATLTNLKLFDFHTFHPVDTTDARSALYRPHGLGLEHRARTCGRTFGRAWDVSNVARGAYTERTKNIRQIRQAFEKRVKRGPVKKILGTEKNIAYERASQNDTKQRDHADTRRRIHTDDPHFLSPYFLYFAYFLIPLGVHK